VVHVCGVTEYDGVITTKIEKPNMEIAIPI
jgi:hypothetical protein